MIPLLDRRYRWYRIKLLKADRTRDWYYFRGASVHEMELAGQRDSDEAGEDILLDRCVVPPEPTDWNKIPAGVPCRLIQEIVRLTGWTEEAVPQSKALGWIESEEGGAEALAIAFITDLDLVKLRTADPEDYWKYIFTGKMMFENLYAMHAAMAFGNAQKPRPAAPAQGTSMAEAVTQLSPRSGPITVDQGGFVWSKDS